MPEPPDTLTVVVGYDGSGAARRALARVHRLAAPELTVLVIAVEAEVRSAGLGSELTDRGVAPERLLDDARRLLDGGQAITLETRALVGDPASLLIQAARELDADLLVVGRRGDDFVARTLLGSVSQRVVRDASCDVLVVA